MAICPDCQTAPMNTYSVEGWIEQICWNCGHYQSDSPAYKENPSMFKNIVRDNPQYFMRKFLKAIPTDEILQRKRTNKDFTEPVHAIYKRGYSLSEYASPAKASKHMN